MAYHAIFYGDEMSKVAIIVETRKHMALSFVLNNVMSILPDEWKLQIFHGLNNLDYTIIEREFLHKDHEFITISLNFSK